MFALAAFWLAQSLAFAHLSRHAASDGAGLPANHATLCTDCASMLPLLVVAGGVGMAFTLVRAGRHAPPVRPAGACVTRAPHPAFRSRAPPR